MGQDNDDNNGLSNLRLVFLTAATGTGKTEAAEKVARDLGMDLIRVNADDPDLAQKLFGNPKGYSGFKPN